MQVESIPIENRDQWLELRKKVITATEVAAITGVHPFKSPAQVWGEKTGVIEGDEDNPVFKRGRVLEPAVFAALLEDRPDLKIERPNVFMMARKERIGGTPDGFATTADGRRLVVEAKTVAKGRFTQAWGDNPEPPIEYYLQALTYAMLSNADGALIAVLIVDSYEVDLRIYEVERHPGAEAKILNAVAGFWKAIDEGREPELDYAKDAEIVRVLRAPKDPEPVDLTGDNLLTSALHERERLLEDKAEIEARLKEIQAEIVDKLAGHEVGLCDGFRLSHKIQQRKEYTVQAASFPVLRVTRPKEASKAA